MPLCAAWVTAAGAESERIIFVQVPAGDAGRSETGHQDAVLADGIPFGSRIILYDRATPEDGAKILTSEFCAAGKPDVSFDGKRILFVGRRERGEPLQMWEMGADGSELRRITDESGGFTAAIYLSTMYTLDAEEPVYQIGFCRNAGGAFGDSLYTCRMDGTRIRQITFDPNGVSDPYLLSDGRLLFTRWSGLRTGGSPASATRNTDLLTVHTDGMDVFVFAAAHEPPAIRSMPCETPDGLVVYVESRAGNSDRGGALVAVSRARSLHTRRVLADDPNGLYHSPSAMSDGRLLVSYRPKTGGTYGVYVFDPESGARVARVFDDPQWHEVDALVLGPRPIPAGRSSSASEGGGYGFLYCMNAYLSDRAEAGFIEPGQIKRLRVLKSSSSPVPSSQGQVPGTESIPSDETTAGDVLGEVPVESDGSFSLQVPARVPLRLQTLDGEGRVLQDMASWIWVMPMETRGCIGCHEDRELTPPNRHTQALRNLPHPVRVENQADTQGGAGNIFRRRPRE